MNHARIFASRHLRLILLCGLAVVWSWPAVGQAQTFKTVQSKQQLYAAPQLSANTLVLVPAGAEVEILQTSSDWYQVNYQGQQGWLPQQAFAEAKKFDLSSVLKGKAVQESRTDEVALAGKGFTPEVEASFRQKNPNLKYDQVDLVEKFQVSPSALQAFIQEGGLQ